MPLLKKDLTFPALVRVIKGYGYNSVSLAKVLGCSQPTAMKKLQSPSLFTLGELYALSTDGAIPLNQIKAAIK